MRIVYFYQYFSTPKGSWGTRVYEFAAEWVKAGHEVTVVSSVYAKSDLRAKNFIENQVFDGVKVKVLNIRIDNKQPKFQRVLSFMQYAIMSSWYALTLPADVVIASSGPITVGLPGLIAHYLRKRKLVFETRDLWPAGAIETGIIKNALIKRASYWFERRCYNASALIVSLSPGMQAYIQTKHRHKNVISVTNAANIKLFSTLVGKPNNLGVGGRKYAIYTGNIGEINNSKWLLDAARILSDRNRQDIVILLVGEGQCRESLEEECKKLQLNNFIIHGLVPKTELVGMIQHSMASLVPLKGSPVLDTSSPNKFFESLSAGIPVIQNTNGWMKDFLKKYKVGFTLRPEDPESLANLLMELADHPEIGLEMKLRAMEVAASEFDKDKLAAKMLEAMVKLSK